MRYSIVYSSKTGNTAMLAEKIKAVLKPEDCTYFGPPDNSAANSDLLFIGFWTDKGGCDTVTAGFLETLQNQKIFLFGTAGFGVSREYFEQILFRVGSHLSPTNTVLGSFMCQGRMPLTVRERYETMLPQDPEKFGGLIRNFDMAMAHPNQADLDVLEDELLPFV